MASKRKAPAEIAHPVVRRSAKKPLTPQVDESETIVSVAETKNADNSGLTQAHIEILSVTDGSQYEVSDHELDRSNDDTHGALRGDANSPAQKSTETLLQNHNGHASTNIPMADVNIHDDAESDQEFVQPTLGELARAHGIIDVTSVPPLESNIMIVQGQTSTPLICSSLESALSQALRTDDAGLLESCLRVPDIKTINNTIERLDSTLAGILLAKLASRMHRLPGRAGSMMTWVRTTLICHGGALAAQPGLVKRLSELQRVLDERARGLNSLQSLVGKLDLLQGQLRFRRLQWNSEVDEDVQEEGVIYVEGEDGDADTVNGLMDLDDDEPRATNDVMDDDSEDDDPQSSPLESEAELDGEEELDEDDVNHNDVESEDDDSEAETSPEPPSKRSKPSRGR